MHRLVLRIFVGSLLLAHTSVFAAPFIPKMNTPESYKDFLFGLDETRQNADSVQCGGWVDTGASVSGKTVSGSVPYPKILGLPGRKIKNENELVDPATGVGERGDYEYPDTAFGYKTACDFRSPEFNPEHLCELDEKATPKNCKKLYDYLKELADDPTLHPIIGNPLCPVQKKNCFDFTEECRGEGCRTPFMPSFTQEPPECHGIYDDDGNLVDIEIDKEEVIEKKLSSFYRNYAAKVTAPTQNPDKVWDIRAECYEYYQEHPGYPDDKKWIEHDPKDIVTGGGDEQCEIVISTPDEDNPDSPEWPDGAGREQREQEDWRAPEEQPRAPRTVPDPWVSDSETNLNLINMERVKDLQREFADPDDITSLVPTILPTRQRASLGTPDDARSDTFDDTGIRTIGTFWEAQQREIQKMIRDPQTRLIMPARFLTGLDDDDPLYQYVRQTVSKSDGTVEVTLRAGLEDIGNVLASLERMFVGPIQEVRIPLIVPLASTAEIESLLFQWKEWQEYDRLHSEEQAKNARNNGQNAQADEIERERALRETKAKALILRLENYRNHSDTARRLRGALPTYLQKLFKSQGEIREFFVRWQIENKDLLARARAASIQRKELQRVWKFVERSMLMTDACQLLWCSNERYTLPIYSLTDGWWEKGEPGTARNLRFKPKDLRDLNYKQPKDAVFDFSHVKFPRDPFLIPVLWPVHAKVKLPIPPAIGTPPPELANFPDLPPIPDETIFNSFPVPETNLPPFSLVTVPDTVDLSEAKDILREFRQIIDGAPPAEQIQQEEQEKNGSLFENLDAEFYGRGAMRDAYCQFPKSVMIPPDEDKGNPLKLIHPEIDLRDRALRLFARWSAQQTEDRAGRVVRISEQFGNKKPPCREDILCYFLPAEVTTTTVWQWFMPTSSQDFTVLGNRLRSDTLPDAEGQNPYLDVSVKTLRRVFGDLSIPVKIELTPPVKIP